MKKKKLAWLVALCTGVVIVVLAVSFYMSNAQYRPKEPAIVLPGENADNPTDPTTSNGANNAIIDGVVVDKANVKDVIRTLHRPAEYYVEATTGIYYHSDKNERGVRVSVKGEMSKTQIVGSSGAATKEIILSPEFYYSWNSGESSFYKGARGDYTYDNASGIPMYEDVLNFEDEAISGASFEKFGDEACICVVVDNQVSLSQDKYYISVSSGLLYAAQSYVDGLVTYEMKQTLLNVKEIPAETFTLPTGQPVQ